MHFSDSSVFMTGSFDSIAHPLCSQLQSETMDGADQGMLTCPLGASVSSSVSGEDGKRVTGWRAK